MGAPKRERQGNTLTDRILKRAEIGLVRQPSGVEPYWESKDYKMDLGGGGR